MDHAIEKAVHGALDYEELERLGLHPQDVCDFSFNANPYGPSPLVRQAIATVAVDRYPDRACLHLRRTILKCELSATHVSLDSIICGNGTAELMWAIAHTYLEQGRKAALLGPTFSEYRAASLAAGATVIEWRMQAAEQFQFDLAAISTWIQTEQPSVVWVCNPNNPTGVWLDEHHVRCVAEVCQQTGAMLVVDEAYWRFVAPTASYSAVDLLCDAEMSHLVVLRSLTKDCALAGLRLGYAVASPNVVERLKAQLPSWNVNSAAQVAGIVALTDCTHLKKTLDDLANESRAFFAALEQIGLYVVPSRTHFCLIDVGDAHAVRQRLLARNILVRDCTSFGLPQFIRVATRQKSEWQQLVRALKELI